VRYLLHRLRSWVWSRIHPLYDEPDDYDEVSTAAFRQWIAGSKHPPECIGGCRCERR